MMAQLDNPQRVSLRFGLVGLIALVMIVPLTLVNGVSRERQSFFDRALAEVAESWGGTQTLAGPFLIVPEEHEVTEVTEPGQVVTRTVLKERIYLPETLELDLDIAHQLRRRAIYEVPVFTAVARFSGALPAPDIEPADAVRVLTDQARLVLGVSRGHAIGGASDVMLATDSTTLRAGTGHPWVGGGVQADLSGVELAGGLPFRFELTLKGSQQLDFTPVGASTSARVTSTWPHPGFDGRYLPERYETSAAGFSAEWSVHQLARGLPDSFLTGGDGTSQMADLASIRLFQPVTEYRLVDRAIKYGLLFIALTFVGLLCFELTRSLRFHPVQYAVVGIGLVLFHLTLLSLSEHLPFGVAYLLATGILSGLVSAYLWAVSRSARLTATLGTVILGLYGALYVLLQLETFALLVGTAVLLLGLGALMYSTRGLAVDPGDERA